MKFPIGSGERINLVPVIQSRIPVLYCVLLNFGVFAHRVLSSRLSTWSAPHYPKDRSNVTFSIESNLDIQKEITMPSFVLPWALLYHVFTLFFFF